MAFNPATHHEEGMPKVCDGKDIVRIKCDSVPSGWKYGYLEDERGAELYTGPVAILTVVKSNEAPIIEKTAEQLEDEHDTAVLKRAEDQAAATVERQRIAAEKQAAKEAKAAKQPNSGGWGNPNG